MIERRHLLTEQATSQAAHDWAQRLQGQVSDQGVVIYLQGELGAGKTAWARAFLRGLGWLGAVKSPSYGLLEVYELPRVIVYHLDLYRLGDPEELEYLGIRDLAALPAIWLIEWPEKGEAYLPQADLSINLSYDMDDDDARFMTIMPISEKATTWLNASLHHDHDVV